MECLTTTPSQKGKEFAKGAVSQSAQTMPTYAKARLSVAEGNAEESYPGNSMTLTEHQR
jgi:hypothetical protein